MSNNNVSRELAELREILASFRQEFQEFKELLGERMTQTDNRFHGALFVFGAGGSESGCSGESLERGGPAFGAAENGMGFANAAIFFGGGIGGVDFRVGAET